MAKLDPRGQAWRKTFSERRCGWPGCTEFVGGRLWACRDHWLRIPYALRDAYMGATLPGPRGSRLPDAKKAGEVEDAILAWIREP